MYITEIITLKRIIYWITAADAARIGLLWGRVSRPTVCLKLFPVILCYPGMSKGCFHRADGSGSCPSSKVPICLGRFGPHYNAWFL